MALRSGEWLEGQNQAVPVAGMGEKDSWEGPLEWQLGLLAAKGWDEQRYVQQVWRGQVGRKGVNQAI